VTPPVTPTPHTVIPLIDLTQDDEPFTSSAARVGRPTNRVSLGKRPRASSPLVVVAAKNALGCAVRLHSVHGASQKTDKHSGFFISSQTRAWSKPRRHFFEFVGRFDMVRCIPYHGSGKISEYNILVWDIISQELGDDNALCGLASTVYLSVWLFGLLWSFVLYTS
jgi:hypothetical protein